MVGGHGSALVNSEASCVADSWRGCELAASLAATWMGYRHSVAITSFVQGTHTEKKSPSTARHLPHLALHIAVLIGPQNVPSHGPT